MHAIADGCAARATTIKIASTHARAVPAAKALRAVALLLLEKTSQTSDSPVLLIDQPVAAGALLIGPFAGSRLSARPMSSVLSTPIAS